MVCLLHVFFDLLMLVRETPEVMQIPCITPLRVVFCSTGASQCAFACWSVLLSHHVHVMGHVCTDFCQELSELINRGKSLG